MWAGGWALDGVIALAGGRRSWMLMDEGISQGRGQVVEESGKAVLMDGSGGASVLSRAVN